MSELATVTAPLPAEDSWNPDPTNPGAPWTELAPLPPPPASARVDLAPSSTPAVHETVEESNWTEKAQTAVTRAQAVETPESWRDAVQATAAVVAMARTMLVAAEAHETAEQMAQMAQTAAETAAEAKLTAEREAHASGEAAHVARLAAEEAARSKQTAERSAKAVPSAARAARLAEAAATATKHAAQDLAKLVAQAREANTPDAWSEALRLASGDQGHGEQRQSDSYAATLREVTRRVHPMTGLPDAG